MKKIVMYTDGACLNNPGPGGWCAILLYNETSKIVSGGVKNTTNNRMELMAVIEGLKNVRGTCEVDVYTDSNYIVQAFKAGWIYSWIKNGWMRKEGSSLKELKNKELWQELWELSQKHKLNWFKVKAHDGVVYNEECDRIARKEATNVG